IVLIKLAIPDNVSEFSGLWRWTYCGLIKTVNWLDHDTRTVIDGVRAIKNHNAFKGKRIVAIDDHKTGTLRQRHAAAIASAVGQPKCQMRYSLPVHYGEKSQDVGAIHSQGRCAVRITGATSSTPTRCGVIISTWLSKHHATISVIDGAVKQRRWRDIWWSGWIKCVPLRRVSQVCFLDAFPI